MRGAVEVPKGTRRNRRESDNKILDHCGRPTDVPGPLFVAIGVLSTGDCDNLRELGLANVFQICTWPPRTAHTPLIACVGGSVTPASTRPSLCLIAARTRSARRAEPQQLEELRDLGPGANCINSGLRKS